MLQNDAENFGLIKMTLAMALSKNLGFRVRSLFLFYRDAKHPRDTAMSYCATVQDRRQDEKALATTRATAIEAASSLTRAGGGKASGRRCRARADLGGSGARLLGFFSSKRSKSLRTHTKPAQNWGGSADSP